MDMRGRVQHFDDALVQLLDAEAGARLIEAVGSSSFGAMLLEIAGSISRVDELFGYMVVDGEEPFPIVSASVLDGSDERVELYMKRFYQHDPAVREISQIGRGESFVQRIGLRDIVLPDYRRQCFSAPGFSEKLSFGWRGGGYLLVLSFYRIDNSDDGALAKLANLANLTLATMVRFHAPVNQESVVAVIERRLSRSFPQLPMRERQVCARTLAGQTANTIGAELGLAPGTVLTYRQRAYQRTGFSKAAEFLPLLVN